MVEKKIRILPENIINKIAAGEVVDRPASIVKELLENSIDAGADQINVSVKNGGKHLISVVDNGCGMNEDDARLSIERHATSKIYRDEDLDHISTLGFRGEALAAIASVSQFELITCDDEQKGATSLNIRGGNLENISKIGFPKGTKISVQNLFYNVPARLKFLKSTPTEFRHIQDVVVQQALTRPHVQFRLTHNGDTQIQLSRGQSLEERIYQLFGDEIQGAMTPIQFKDHYLELSGFVSPPNLSKPTKRWQYLFVNDRFVKCQALVHAIYHGYRTLLMKNQHPVFFLNVKLDAGEIDVNVHPAKTEIRLRNAALLHTLISNQLQRQINDVSQRQFTHDKSIPLSALRDNNITDTRTKSSSEEKSNPKGISPPQSQAEFSWPQKQNSLASFALHATQTSFPVPAMKAQEATQADKLTPSTPASHETMSKKAHFADTGTKAKDSEVQHPLASDEAFHFQPLHPKAAGATNPRAVYNHCQRYHPLGQLRKTYILTEGPDGLVLFDQHAAHERILFEKYRLAFYQGGIQTEAYLVPVILELSPQNAILLEQYLPQFRRLGFEIEPFGRCTYVIQAIPAILTGKDCKKPLLDVLDELGLFGKSGRMEEVFNEVIERVACHSAIRAGQSLSQEEMVSLIAQLEQMDIHFYCPHGRPVMIELSEAELEKRFKRVV